MVDALGSMISDHGPKEARIGIKISKKLAAHREGQLLLWMTCNLICRLRGTIKEVEICVPHDIEWSAPAYMPFGSASSNLKDNLAHVLSSCARDCGIVFVNDDLHSHLDAIILIGRDTTTQAKAGFVRNVTCDGWMAYIGSDKTFCDPEHHTNSNNPFGAFAASCIIVGEIFKFLLKIEPSKGNMITSLCFSSYEFRSDLKLWERPENPSLDKSVDLGQVHICGAGAVAHAFCQALFAINGLKGRLFLIDRSKDPNHTSETIESTNLARYIMASNHDEGKPKAELLAERMSAMGIPVDFSDDGLASYVNNSNVRFSQVISCVDNNDARHAIQDQIPRVIHGGSISELRAQVSIYDLGHDSYQCLKCYNPIEDGPSDSDTIERLKAMSSSQRSEESLKNDVEPQILEDYIQNPQCGEVDLTLFQRSPELHDGETFSVNFVSALAGVLLAAEIVKTKAHLLRPILGYNQKTDLYYRFGNNTCHLAPSKSEHNCWCNAGSTTPRDAHKIKWPHH